MGAARELLGHVPFFAVAREVPAANARIQGNTLVYDFPIVKDDIITAMTIPLITGVVALEFAKKTKGGDKQWLQK